MSLSTNTTKLTELKNKANNLPDQNPPAQLQEKTVTPTKEGLSVVPDSGFDGLSKVTVNGDSNLVPENIKEGVSIFEVLGTLSSIDIMYVKTKSLQFTGKDEEVDLTNLPYLPFMILIIEGDITSFPNNKISQYSQHYGIYIRGDHYDYTYIGSYNDEKYYYLGASGFAEHSKNPNGTYNITGLGVYKYYMSGTYKGREYTAILLGKVTE